MSSFLTTTWITLYYYVCSIQSQPIYAKQANYSITQIISCPDKQITIISTYFFRIVKERNYLLDPKDQT